MKRIFLISIVIINMCAIGGGAYAQEEKNAEVLFYKGNEYYEQGAYDQALVEYLALEDRDRVSGNLYFNIGNCYFKKNELGKAILYYEKALRLMPRDGDILSNYSYAKSLMKETAMNEKRFFLMRIIDFFYHFFSVNELCIILSVLFVVLIALVFLRAVLNVRTVYITIAFVMLLIFFVTGGISLGERILLLNKEGIIIQDEIPAKFAPFDRATTHFTLYEGMYVVVVEKKGSWTKVRRRDGNTGWVKRDAFEII